MKKAKPKQTRKSFSEMKKELIALAKETPTYVNLKDYETFLDSQLLRRMSEGRQRLDTVKKMLLNEASQTSDLRLRKELQLAIEEVEDSIVAYEYGGLKYNAPLRKERMLLWPAEQLKKKKKN